MNFSLKKILLTTFILLEVSALFAFSAFPMPVEKEAVITPMKTKISISFEIARRRDCTGFGICNLTVGISLERVNSCTGSLYADETSRNVFILEINKAQGISAATYDKYFKSGIFVMEDESPIPSEALKEMGITGTRTMLAGNHKVTEKAGILYVAIPVK